MHLFFNHSLYVRDSNEKLKNKEILDLIKDNLQNNNLYSDEGKSYIIKQLSHQDFVGSSIQVILKPFRTEPCVSLDEKKSYKINTRQKINKDFFDLLSEQGKTQEYVLHDLENLILSTQNKIHNKYSLLEYKKIGIKKVEISCCNDDRDCPAVKKYCNKVYPINEAPLLPLPDCTADVCRCIYLSVQ